MKFYNIDQGEYILDVFLREDVDCCDLLFEIDGTSGKIPLSNQGHYKLYLNHFQSCFIEDNPKIVVNLCKWQIEFEKSIKKYQKLLLEEPSDLLFNKEELYLNLPTEKTERIYHIFKRLLYLAKKSLLEMDNDLKVWLIEQVRLQIRNYYSGKENYQGNWWIFEIGIPRCLNEIIILFYEEISKEEIFHWLAIENFYIPCAEYEYYRRNYPNVKPCKTSYANLADNIYICLTRAMLLQNDEEIQYLYELLPQLIVINERGNGFKKDGGFIYHENIPYTASYGEVLLYSIAKILEIYQLLQMDCEVFFQQLYIRIQISFLPFLYHKKALNCVRGRAISRKEQNEQYSFSRIMIALTKLAKIFSQKGFLDYIYNEQNFYYYAESVFLFNSMNRYIKRNSTYLLAISAHSNFIANYESINQENLLGSYQANFTYDLYYNDERTNDVLKINPFYRNGSTNVLELEPANSLMENRITAGVSCGLFLNTCFHQNNEVKGYFTKIILDHSIVCIGTNISSSKEYVSTLYSFEEDYEIHNNEIETKIFKIWCKELPIITTINESRSYSDLNKNEQKEEKKFVVKRIYYKNPKSYFYQFYPSKQSIVDEIFLEKFDDSHILRYKDVLFINSFENKKTKYKNILFSGYFCMCMNLSLDKIEIKIIAYPTTKIFLSILGYSLIFSELKSIGNNNYYFEEYKEYKMIFIGGHRK